MPKGMKNMRTLLLMIFAALSLSVSAQTITLNGNVKDTTGEPIIGASIVEKGNTTNGTITDLDGNFSLKVPANATVVISYIGMKTQEIAIKGKSKIDVTLSDDAKALDEVVVIGYGTAKRKDITGSVASVNSETLAAIPVASATEALQGKMAGVQITTTEGSPDAQMSIRVRGGGSITQSNEPLFIVDGFPVESISDIPPTDIESIDVLKDASSTAIYGARGANGVIIVTTKSGKEGKVSVSYNAYYAWKKVAKTLDVLSASDYTKWQYELAQLTNKNDDYIKYFGNYQDLDMYDNVATNDWQDLTFGRTGHSFNHNLSINGGSDKFKYSFSYSHIDDKAIMQMSDYARDNLNLKLNHKPLKNVSLDFSARFSKTKINGGGSNDANSSLNTDKRLKYSLLYTPYPVPGISDALNADEEDANSLLINPLISLRDNDTRKERINYNLAGSITWEIIKDLKLKAEVGYDDYRNNADRYYGVTTYYVRNNVDDEDKSKPAISFTRGTRTAFRSTNTLSYDFKKFFKNNKNHLNLGWSRIYCYQRERIKKRCTWLPD
jgi:TonB-linked SusC/RagA family outer membrane protein